MISSIKSSMTIFRTLLKRRFLTFSRNYKTFFVWSIFYGNYKKLFWFGRLSYMFFQMDAKLIFLGKYKTTWVLSFNFFQMDWNKGFFSGKYKKLVCLSVLRKWKYLKISFFWILTFSGLGWVGMHRVSSL